MTQMTDGGGELVGYFLKDQIQKITRKIYLSYGIETNDYYFTNGRLIFVYELFNMFVYDDKLSKFDYEKTKINFIGRYYFKDKQLIDSETTGHNRFENDALDIEATLTKESNECIENLNKKVKNNSR